MGKKISGFPAVPAADAAAEGLFTVQRVAADLGVPVDAVVALLASDCTAALHFTEVRGVLIFTEAGVAHVRATIEARMRADVASANLAEEPAPHAEQTSLTEDLRVSRVFPWSGGKKTTSLNVLAERPNGNEVVLVVKDVTHLEAGMVLAGCVRGENAWYYMGRLPRSFGQRQLFFPPAKTTRRTSSK